MIRARIFTMFANEAIEFRLFLRFIRREIAWRSQNSVLIEQR